MHATPVPLLATSALRPALRKTTSRRWRRALRWTSIVRRCVSSPLPRCHAKARTRPRTAACAQLSVPLVLPNASSTRWNTASDVLTHAGHACASANGSLRKRRAGRTDDSAGHPFSTTRVTAAVPSWSIRTCPCDCVDRSQRRRCLIGLGRQWSIPEIGRAGTRRVRRAVRQFDARASDHLEVRIGPATPVQRPLPCRPASRLSGETRSVEPSLRDTTR